MNRISFQWRITLMTAVLIAGACICLNLLLYRSGATGMDNLNGYVLQYQQNDDENLMIEIPDDQMSDFLVQFSQEVYDAKAVFGRKGWCITAAVTLLSAAIAYFVSGKALEPLKKLAQQAERIDQDSLVEVRLEENTIPEFRAVWEPIAALAEDSQPLSTLANASALLYEALPDINWVGFYLASGDMLHLGPFQGRTACTQIPFGRGVCGTAAATRQVQVVQDVQRFPGHIACDSASRSEIVLPIWVDGRLLGVLDIDSPSLNRFTEEDADGLTAFVAALTRSVDFAHGLLK